jgi:two-component system sensor histidine kinase KdpD
MKTAGKLTVFLGMAPGVGKTYAMLQAALAQSANGVDVVIAYVETHDRAETAALTTTLPHIPRKKVPHRGQKMCEEMDLDATLSRDPELALVDELAHTNTPGERHEKRWQDVTTLLAAGIDVYTTLNIQHIESRHEEVHALSGITVSETVPDLLLENAEEIRFIDFPPKQLRQRLKDGKVYASEKITQALTHFFTEDTLSGLRELALRFMAEKVDTDLKKSATFQTRKNIWNLNDRLMVAVSHSPSSKYLIRTARRLAFSLGAPWIAVYVNTGLQLHNKDKEQLSRNLELAKNLGAEIVTTTDTDLIEALKRIAKEQNVTKIVTGRSPVKWWHGISPSLSNRFVKKLDFVDVYVLKNPSLFTDPKRRIPKDTTDLGKGSGIAAILLLAALAIGIVLLPILGYRAIGFVFLLGVLLIGTFASLPVIFVTSVVSATLWDIFFIPPRGQFVIQAPEDIAMCLTFLGVTLVIGMFSRRLKARERMIGLKENQTFLLYQAATCFSQTVDIETCMEKLNTLISPRLQLTMTVINKLPHFLSDSKENAVLEWSFLNKTTAGWGTDTLPFAKNWYIPLIHQDNFLGLLGITPQHRQTFLPEEKGLILNIAQQISTYIQAVSWAEDARKTKELAESEKRYALILQCISHELRTPLTSIFGNLALLKHECRAEEIQEIETAAKQLTHIIENLLDISRLNTGQVTMHMDWIDLRDTLSTAIQVSTNIQMDLPDTFPFLWGDPILIERLLANLLANALQYAPPNSAILVSGTYDDSEIKLAIRDEGPGVPAAFHETIFEKFFRVPGSKTGGTGLGLAICKEIVACHGGKTWVENMPTGFCVHVTFPLRKTPHLSQEIPL